MKKLNSKDADGIVMALMFMVFIVGIFSYIAVFDIIYQDTDGNPVVCEIEGTYYSINHPKCQTAVQGTWKRTNSHIWKGSCDINDVCVPDPQLWSNQ